MKLSEKYPDPHAKYVVCRDGVLFTATPCYGLHEPWWVVRVLGDTYEADPEPMQESDEWWPLNDFMKGRSDETNEAGELVAAAIEVLEFEKPVVKNKSRRDAVARLGAAVDAIQKGSASKPSDVGN